MATTPPQLVAYRTGNAAPIVLARGAIEAYDPGGGALWFPNNRAFLFRASEPGHSSRTYMQGVDGGDPRSVLPESVRAALVSRDGLVVAIVRWIAAPSPRTHHWRRESGRHQTVTTHLADVGDRERMRELAREVAGAHGAVHLLINKAVIGFDAVWLNRKLSPVRMSNSCVW